MEGKIISINISEKKSIRKKPVESAKLIENLGIYGDAHAEGGIRQVSLLAIESIRKMIDLGLEVKPGDFAENITTEGLDLLSLPVGSKLNIGDVVLEVSQHGKICHTKCNIYKTVGDCVMPREGIFCKVIKGGEIKKGDIIKVI
ncbi:MAG: MOSC domain-containing protein [Proteobacteria bacterium]|nr:MOSC domain-containing protein [Pseudomonadota bacterium]